MLMLDTSGEAEIAAEGYQSADFACLSLDMSLGLLVRVRIWVLLLCCKGRAGGGKRFLAGVALRQ